MTNVFRQSEINSGVLRTGIGKKLFDLMTANVGNDATVMLFLKKPKISLKIVYKALDQT